MRAGIVLTTINDPVCLEEYYRNFEKYGHLEHIQVYLIPDLKTPAEAYRRCKELSKRGLKIICPTIEEQENFLKTLGLPPNFIPYNSDNRRNIGYLMALQSGCDFIISIDDDNYPRDDMNFLAEHSVVLDSNHKALIVNTQTGWFNICSLMKLDREEIIYPRGFPYFARHKPCSETYMEGNVDIHINVGLWLIDPDIDGISRLVAPAHTLSFKGKSVVLDKKVWSPINTQNTSLRRDVIASYYFVKMNYPLGGIYIDRYGDIFSGYFAQACVKYMNGSIRIGTPIVDHRRNSHNYFKDAISELPCIMVLEDILLWLPEVKLSGNTYAEAYEALSYELEDAVERFKGYIWNDATRAYFHQMAYYMRKWIKACKLIEGY